MKTKIIDSYKQFGIWGLCSRTIRKCFSLIGISHEDYYLLTRNLNDCKKRVVTVSDGVELRILRLSDFENSYKNNNYLQYPSSKMDLVADRFDNSYEAFGAFFEGELIYASWISYEREEMPGAHNGEKLPNDTALLLDDFCAPHMRQKGIHGAVNQMRLNRLLECNSKYVIVTVMCVNKPALKSHLKNGFNIYSKYYTLSIFGRKLSNLNKIMRKYETNR